MVQTANAEDQDGEAGVKSQGEWSRGRPAQSGGARNQLGDGGSGQQSEEPDADKLQRGERPIDLKQQSEHDQAKPEIVRFGQRVQAAERVRKPQQPDRACEEKEGAGATR